MSKESRKISVRKYQQSPKGRAALRRAQRRYEETRRGKARAKRYSESAKGKETMAACCKLREKIK